MTSRIWLADPPKMPPSAELSPPLVVFERTGRPAKRLAVALVVIMLLDALILGAHVGGRALGFVVVSPLALYLLLAARRSFGAVGPDWLYERTEAFGSGKWTRISDVATVKVRQNRGRKTMTIKTRQGQTFRQGVPASGGRSAAQAELARQLLATRAVITPDARNVLVAWQLHRDARTRPVS